MKRYVCGFLFDPKKRHVALIRKNKPEWQKGKLNGIGGKIELSDKSPMDAMRREFNEEAGLDISTWKPYFEVIGPDYIVYFYTAISQDLDSIRSLTDERVEIHLVEEINDLNVIPNLKWLVPAAADADIKSGVVYYNY